MIRPARRADAASFMGHYRTVVEERKFIRSESVRWSARHMRRRFRHSWTDDRVSLVAVAEGEVIGHLDAAREDQPATRHVASFGMAVAPGWRGRGVGSALMGEAIRWARSVGVEKLALSVYPDNAAALALYRKFDFVQEGRLSGHSKKSFGYRDEIVMGRWLVPQPDPGEGPW